MTEAVPPVSTASPKSDAVVSSPPPAGRLKILLVSATIFTFLVAIIVVWVFLRSYDLELSAAKKAGRIGDWNRARSHLEKYLWLHSHSAEGRMLMAEACIKAERNRDVAIAAARARQHLQQIRGTARELAKARLQEGRLALFLQFSPSQAEQLLRESLQLDNSDPEGFLLMWQLLDLTGRHILSDEFFWKAFELSSRENRERLIRDWFLSEFYPNDLHGTLFEQLGIRGTESIPASIHLIVRFRETEPNSPTLHAALASYYRGLGNLKAAADLLTESRNTEASFNDAFFVSVLFETLVDLGQFEKAATVFNQFPKPHEGYLYWRCAGLYQDYVVNDSSQAAESIRKAMQFTPGKLDWGLMNREAACLRKLGRTGEGDVIQKKVERLTRQILTMERTSDLRRQIRSPDSSAAAGKFADFYREFDLEREVAAWSQQTTP